MFRDELPVGPICKRELLLRQASIVVPGVLNGQRDLPEEGKETVIFKAIPPNEKAVKEKAT